MLKTFFRQVLKNLVGLAKLLWGFVVVAGAESLWLWQVIEAGQNDFREVINRLLAIILDA